MPHITTLHERKTLWTSSARGLKITQLTFHTNTQDKIQPKSTLNNKKDEDKTTQLQENPILNTTQQLGFLVDKESHLAKEIRRKKVSPILMWFIFSESQSFFT